MASFISKLGDFLRHQLTSRFAAKTLGFSIFGTGSYIFYKDSIRYPRMMRMYETGNFLPPITRSDGDYFKRPALEAALSQLMTPECTNEYHLINGEVGTGKSRSILEVVCELMQNEGPKKTGAPVYVIATQGKSFSDSLAEAVNFKFDEHLSFNLFMDFVLGVRAFPGQQEHHKLDRVLDAIEESAFRYFQKTRRPVVLIIDGVNALEKQLPGTMRKLQYKAKLWADTNIVKIIFVTNDEDTEEQFRSNSSLWSRLGAPFRVGDLSKEDSITFLQNDNSGISQSVANDVYRLVGGRIRYLITFKRDLARGVDCNKIELRMRAKEREKFINVVEDPVLWDIVKMIKQSPGRTVNLVKLTKKASRCDIIKLAESNVIKLERNDNAIVIAFESKLTENVVDDIRSKWE